MVLPAPSVLAFTGVTFLAAAFRGERREDEIGPEEERDAGLRGGQEPQAEGRDEAVADSARRAAAPWRSASTRPRRGSS
jgi:hypothetical protein